MKALRQAVRTVDQTVTTRVIVRLTWRQRLLALIGRPVTATAQVRLEARAGHKKQARITPLAGGVSIAQERRGAAA